MYGIIDDGELIAKFSTPLSVVSNQPSFVGDSLSLKRSAQKRTGQRWEITAPVEPLRHTANDLFCLFTEKGVAETYDIRMPQNVGAVHHRVPSNNPEYASGGAGSETVNAVTSSYIPRGTFIKFANHDKIYLVMNNRDGDGEIRLKPALRVTVSGSPFFWKEDVVGKFFLDMGQTQGMRFTDGVLMDNGSLTFVEAV